MAALATSPLGTGTTACRAPGGTTTGHGHSNFSAVPGREGREGREGSAGAGPGSTGLTGSAILALGWSALEPDVSLCPLCEGGLGLKTCSETAGGSSARLRRTIGLSSNSSVLGRASDVFRKHAATRLRTCSP
mmetsp:Transcript_33367/g.72929  ORF Transcript_33367/g.72929 Transcript_33367/m.72929 type:complete len:133 (-) Transcript_33367:851-1249(-)